MQTLLVLCLRIYLRPVHMKSPPSPPPPSPNCHPQCYFRHWFIILTAMVWLVCVQKAGMKWMQIWEIKLVWFVIANNSKFILKSYVSVVNFFRYDSTGNGPLTDRKTVFLSSHTGSMSLSCEFSGGKLKSTWVLWCSCTFKIKTLFWLAVTVSHRHW